MAQDPATTAPAGDDPTITPRFFFASVPLFVDDANPVADGPYFYEPFTGAGMHQVTVFLVTDGAGDFKLAFAEPAAAGKTATVGLMATPLELLTTGLDQALVPGRPDPDPAVVKHYLMSRITHDGTKAVDILHRVLLGPSDVRRIPAEVPADVAHTGNRYAVAMRTAASQPYRVALFDDRDDVATHTVVTIQQDSRPI